MSIHIEDRMKAWDDGELSDSEILGWLINAMSRVYLVMREKETKEAEARMERLGLKPAE